VPGLGASFGRGAATNYQQDLANSDCVLIMGSNMAEAHPVGFRWPLKAREQGAKLIHVDPRFSRTSALCDLHVPIRAGSDIAFLGGLIHYVLQHERWFKEYVLAYTNATTLVEDGYRDSEELEGLFSGYDESLRTYDPAAGHWGYAHEEESQGEKKESAPNSQGEEQQHGGHQSGPRKQHAGPGYARMGGYSHHASPRGNPSAAPRRDPTLQDSRCVLNVLRRHFARYTPDAVAAICGCTPQAVKEVADLLCENSGRERTSAIVYAVGWTQHSTGVQIIRAAGILQLLLGNMGRPGGGIMAMRGHASIQGSTDIPTLYDLLPGYLAQPAVDPSHETLDSYVEYESMPTGYWVHYRRFIVSLLKAWYGNAAQKDNEFRFGWLPRLDNDYSQLAFFDRMQRGEVSGYFLFGQNPAGGGPNAGLHRAALRQLDWLVVCDWFQHESAVFWKDDPKGPPAVAVKTEVFFFPMATVQEKEGCFTNTQRLLQWHDKAVDPPADCRSDAWFVYELGKRLKALYADSTKPRDQALINLTWEYDHKEPPRLPDGTASRLQGEPDIAKILQEINGRDLTRCDDKTGEPVLLRGFSDLQEDGTTDCGCWIYSGVFPEPGHNRARSRTRSPDNPLHPEWGFAWPHNRRILYNRASADPSGKPWSERKRLLYWDPAKKRWSGLDAPDFPPDKAPDYVPQEGAKGMAAISGTAPFIMKPDGRGWLFAMGPKDGPLPAHYEPVESPIGNRLYPRRQDSPTVRYFPGPLNAIAHKSEKDYPIIACTFRLTEHYLSGPMSRWNSWLNELMPEMFIELSPELAAEKGIEPGGWVTVLTPRGQIAARALVTRRIRPITVEGRLVHQIGVPFHWGYAGETVGAIANDLTSLVADPNVSMHEGKVFACQVQPGRLTSSADGQPAQPTVPPAPWPTREPAPDTPEAAQPEGHLK